MTIKCKGELINFNTPKIFGILNITPDSFFDGGKYTNSKSILKQCEKMINDGADFIDIGAQTSKPGSKEISLTEELNRLIPFLEIITKEFPEILISIDTYRSQVAEKSIQLGASIINDISSGENDEKMMAIISKYDVPYIMMHKKGKPRSMQLNPSYENVTKELIYYFSKKINQAYEYGINDIIIDPGFGFGKNLKHNYKILKDINLFHKFKLPIMIGVSRKSMIYNKLNVDIQNSLNGTTILNTFALINKTQILRVHDVKEAKECIKLLQELK